MAEEEKRSIGDIIYDAIAEDFVIEKTGWVTERIERIQARFKKHHSFQHDFEVIVPWLSPLTAFTAPGKYIFFSRSLFQLCSDDEMAAFIIAHEIAHHELGHLDKFPEFLANTTRSEIKLLIAALYRVVETRIHGPRLECDADQYALDLCIAAGYEAEKCLRIFGIMEKISLDMGDIDGVYGPAESDEELAVDAPLMTKIRIWLYHSKRGYLPIRDRREMLIQHLEKQGHQVRREVGL